MDAAPAFRGLERENDRGSIPFSVTVTFFCIIVPTRMPGHQRVFARRHITEVNVPPSVVMA